MIDIAVLDRLNASTREQRLRNLRESLASAVFPPAVPRYINNHIHTTYSFSPYSPTAAVYAARSEGLSTAGIVDHDSLAGAREFLDAAELLQMPVTVGMECRASMKDTPMEGRRLNNPDQSGICYMTIQSIPHDRIDEVQAFFAPYREAREQRNRLMTERINRILPGIRLDYDREIRPLSMAREGGTVTERHILYALARKMLAQTGKGLPMVEYLTSIGLTLSEKQRTQMLDESYPFYAYDLLGILKGAFVKQFYVDATEECPDVRVLLSLCRKVDALLCYSYLGDVTASVTGDKLPQKFEDDYLEELIACLKQLGIPAVTYMPTRNTPQQLQRIRTLCEANRLIQVSGEDINSPRQSFVIRAMDDPALGNLIDTTWMMIRHERDGKPLQLPPD